MDISLTQTCFDLATTSMPSNTLVTVSAQDKWKQNHRSRYKQSIRIFNEQ